MTQVEKQLTLQDLNPGDVLVMQGPQDISWLEVIEKGDMDAALVQAIMWLTNSDVCHGAIYCGEQNGIFSLIDDGEKGVGQHGMTTEAGKGDHWYVRRISQQPSLQPVLAQAMHYKNVPTAYDWELLTLLGLLLIYKKITPNTQFYQELLVVLEKLVVSLDQLTHSQKVDYFVCSQFVAACFDQAGKPYELDVINGNLNTQNGEGLTVIDHCVSQQGSPQINGSEHNFQTVEPLCAKDIQSLVENSARDHQTPATTSEQSRMQQACDQFLQLFFKLNAAALGLSANDYATAEQRIQLAQQYQADFVTPADLKNHCSNLQAIGKIRFVYGEAMP